MGTMDFSNYNFYINDEGNIVYNFKPQYLYPKIKKIIYNLKNPTRPTTIVIWEDGTKTIVKCCKGEDFTKEGGLAQAYLKKILGSRGNIQRLIENADIQQ